MNQTATDTHAITVVIADDHTILRQGIRRLLEGEAIRVLGEAKDGREAIDTVRALKPDLIIMDIVMPTLDGLDAARRILKMEPRVRVLILSMFFDDDSVSRSLEAGVSGYVLKDAPASELVSAVRRVAAGEAYFAARIPASVVARHWVRGIERASPSIDLTRREREVLKLLAEGRTVKEVADSMKLSQKTIDTHKTNLMKKLDIHNRVELVKYAIQKKIIEV